jgi:hypothetical protein
METAMMQVKIGVYLVLGLFVAHSVNAQRILSEAKLAYTITAIAEKGNESLVNAFNNASQTVWLRGNMARVDFFSETRAQSTIFNQIKGTATILRTSGNERYQWNLDSMEWQKTNKRWTGANYRETGETADIAGFLCEKVIASLPNDSTITIFYTKQLIPLAKGYDLLFEPLDGIVLQYEINMDGLKIIFKAKGIETTPVGAARFDIPKTGYKIIQAPKLRPENLFNN